MRGVEPRSDRPSGATPGVGGAVVFASALALLLVAGRDVAQTLAAPGGDFWLWVERLSWVGTLAAVVFAGYEVRRVADELARRPDLRFGFAPGYLREIADLRDR